MLLLLVTTSSTGPQSYSPRSVVVSPCVLRLQPPSRPKPPSEVPGPLRDWVPRVPGITFTIPQSLAVPTLHRPNTPGTPLPPSLVVPHERLLPPPPHPRPSSDFPHGSTRHLLPLTIPLSSTPASLLPPRSPSSLPCLSPSPSPLASRLPSSPLPQPPRPLSLPGRLPYPCDFSHVPSASPLPRDSTRSPTHPLPRDSSATSRPQTPPLPRDSPRDSPTTTATPGFSTVPRLTHYPQTPNSPAAPRLPGPRDSPTAHATPELSHCPECPSPSPPSRARGPKRRSVPS